MERLCRTLAEAADCEQVWLKRVRAGLLALLAFLDQEPESGWARRVILEHEQLAIQEATRRVHGALWEVLDAGRGQVIVASQLTPQTLLIAELLATAVLSIVRARMLAGEHGTLLELAPSLMEHILEPYLGAGARYADIARDPSLPVPAPAEARILPIRAHARLLRALQLIDSEPGISGRELEIALTGKDKRGRHSWHLLKPLKQRGLLENTRPNTLPYQSNAWHLTPYGHRTLELLDHSAASSQGRSRRVGSRHPLARPKDRRARARRSAV